MEEWFTRLPLLERDVSLQTEVPFLGGGRVRLCRPHRCPLTFLWAFTAWVGSPVVWALPASATESGFLPGAESAPLFSALTTWTNPVIINHLVDPTFPAAFAFSAFLAIAVIPGKIT